MRGVRSEAPNWDYIYRLLTELAEKIRKDGFKPDMIIGISRGGWVPARVLSDLLDNPSLASIGVEFYSGIYETTKKPVITQPLSLSAKDKRVLVVDDVVDTGASLRLIHDELSKEAKGVKTASVYRKPWSSFKPDYYAKDTGAWVIFPWEIYEAVKILGNNMLKEGADMEDVENRLIEIGLSAAIVKRLVRHLFRKKQNEDHEER